MWLHFDYLLDDHDDLGRCMKTGGKQMSLLSSKIIWRSTQGTMCLKYKLLVTLFSSLGQPQPSNLETAQCWFCCWVLRLILLLEAAAVCFLQDPSRFHFAQICFFSFYFAAENKLQKLGRPLNASLSGNLLSAGQGLALCWLTCNLSAALESLSSCLFVCLFLQAPIISQENEGKKKPVTFRIIWIL